MMLEVIPGVPMLRVSVYVDGVGYSAGMNCDGDLELARRGDVVDTGRFDGRRIVDVTGESSLPPRAFEKLEEALQGAASLVQWLASPAAPATAPGLVP
ncbi:hypothetical protein WME76_02090 [Sorangium sp. So ce119]|uniref:hypothetical protein n=1 Tax=Sorangium sp. So ce119 TaxID=3133279 RepID=UPI003F5ECABA